MKSLMEGYTFVGKLIFFPTNKDFLLISFFFFLMICFVPCQELTPEKPQGLAHTKH